MAGRPRRDTLQMMANAMRERAVATTNLVNHFCPFLYIGMLDKTLGFILVSSIAYTNECIH